MHYFIPNRTAGVRGSGTTPAITARLIAPVIPGPGMPPGALIPSEGDKLRKSDDSWVIHGLPKVVILAILAILTDSVTLSLRQNMGRLGHVPAKTGPKSGDSGAKVTILVILRKV